MKLSWSACGAEIGDKIYNQHTKKVGIVIKKGQSGNYTLLYVDFGNKNLTKINPLDDAQVRHNYFKVLS